MVKFRFRFGSAETQKSRFGRSLNFNLVAKIKKKSHFWIISKIRIFGQKMPSCYSVLKLLNFSDAQDALGGNVRDSIISMKKNYDSRFRRVESKQLRAGPKGSKGDKGGIGQTGMPGVIREGRKGEIFHFLFFFNFQFFTS